MKLENIGKQIGILRKDLLVTRERLCDGICTEAQLAMLETGERAADMIVLGALLERLGKSAERLTYILTIEEYERLASHDDIDDLLCLGRLEEARKAFEQYKKENPLNRNKILIMYEEKIEGILALAEYERGLCRKEPCRSEKQMDTVAAQEKSALAGRGKLQEAAGHFRRATAATLPFKELFGGWLTTQIETGSKLLAMFEIENILLCVHVRQLAGHCGKDMELLEALRTYLEKLEDEELRAQYLAKVAILLGKMYLTQHRDADCIQMHESILQSCREQSILVCVIPLMEQLIRVYGKSGNKERAEFYTVHKQNLEAIFSDYGLPIDSVNKLYSHCSLRQYFIEGELIAAQRRWKGMTQEELAAGIYQNVENLSRIENGKENSVRAKFYQMMERLEVDKTRYNGNLLTDEYRVLELDRDIEKHLARKQYEEVGHGLYMLEKCADMTERCNRQFVWGLKNMEAYRSGKISTREAQKTAEELLRLTYPLDDTMGGDVKYLRIPFRNEMYLFNQICILSRKNGQIKKSIAMMQKMMRTYGAMKEKEKFHFQNVGLCAENLCKYLEIEDQLEEAGKLTDKTIIERLRAGKITNMHRIYATKFDIAEKRADAAPTCDTWLQRAYLLSIWCCNEEDAAVLEKVIKSRLH